ncbi:MAG: iron ABC transporter permease, partial [Rhodospirillales bacterium]|nr:iron ABC transporter permease [Rhodospirillales bacterium]
VARTLGCGPWRSFAAVALPLARPAIVSGLALALMETLNDFGTVQYFAVDTFTTGLYRTWFGLGEPAAAAQLGAVLMLFVLALLLVERLSRGRARFGHTTTRLKPLKRLTLRPLPALGAMLLCLVPVLLGFLLPAALLLTWTLQTAFTSLDAAFLRHAGHSLMLAAVAALVAVAVGLLLAYGQRLKPAPGVRWAVRVAGLGYAVPGAVIAVGTLLPCAWADNSIDAWMRLHFGVSTGLLLSGTITALVYAYCVRFLAVSLNTVEASLGKVTPSMDAAARSLGESRLGVLKRVHLPLVRGSLLTAGLLVFVDVMKELPATLILRPFNFDTLAIRAYQMASDERLRDAAAPGLAIVAVGILPVILLSMGIARSRPGRKRD